jgi:hypothetical protein
LENNQKKLIFAAAKNYSLVIQLQVDNRKQKTLQNNQIKYSDVKSLSDYREKSNDWQ